MNHAPPITIRLGRIRSVSTFLRDLEHFSHLCAPSSRSLLNNLRRDERKQASDQTKQRADYWPHDNHYHTRIHAGRCTLNHLRIVLYVHVEEGRMNCGDPDAVDHTNQEPVQKIFS